MKVKSDTIKLDSFSIIPSSLFIYDSLGLPIDSNIYSVDYAKAMIFFNKNIKNIEISIKYSVFPYNFSKNYYHKLRKKENKSDTSIFSSYIENSNDISTKVLGLGGLNKSGSISRGISFGNNQDVFVNSNLNLQLSGNLSEKIELLAVITDQNIPIQPEGNTQQIQEFDKVFIQLSDKNNKLIAGDFELQRPQSYFLNFNKKSQGLLLSSSFKTKSKIDSKDKDNVKASIALAKGKFTRNQINGIEGNQGPYQLTGNNNEMYIVIIAGSEKVYIDGEVLTRGQENDYIIDYNLAQLSFTPKKQITKDKRITVEFEYTDINYTRSLFFIGNEWEHKNILIRFNYFIEQDLKNQPIQQELSNNDKKLLASIGDSLQNAFTYNIDSIAFNSNQVLYKMIDSLGFDSVFVYSTNADSAHYRLGFSNLGQGQGNYIQINTITNGRVFKWIKPINNQPQGNYEPVVLLITPQKKQMITIATDYLFNKKTKISVETAFSNKDVNLYSTKDKNDDNGFAIKFNILNKQKLWQSNKKEWNYLTEINSEIVQKQFNQIERFRNVEFERDWNLSEIKTIANEYINSLKLSLLNKKSEYVSYQFLYFTKGTYFKAIKNSFGFNLTHHQFYYYFDGNLLKSNDIYSSSEYLKQKFSIIKKVKYFSFGIKEEQENNKIKFKTNKTFSPSSFSFLEGELFVGNPDSSNNKYNLYYKRRIDWLPLIDKFNISTLGESYGFSTDLVSNSNNGLKISSSYRKLFIYDTLLSSDEASKSLVGRLECFFYTPHGFIKTSAFYEIGSGNEIKKDFSYLEVTPGQGVYSWSDYNNNGLKELNEFDIAQFKDQATYIKIFIPTNQTIKTYTNQYNQTFIINPSAILKNKNVFNNFINRLYYSAIYNVDRKVTSNLPQVAYSPWNTHINDSILVSINSTFKNTLFFNKTNTTWGLDFVFQQSNNKTLLINGFDTRLYLVKGIKLRWNLNRLFSLFFIYNNGIKTNNSEFLKTRDFSIHFYEIEPTFSFQTNTIFRISIFTKYTDKHNQTNSPNEKTLLKRYGTEIKYNILAKSSLVGRFSYSKIDYNAEENTSLAFEMLEGLKIGKNYLWNISYQRNISDNLQLNINYEGRKSNNLKVIHLGTVQLRAYF